MQPQRGRIILVRHGETEANRLRLFAADDVHLTDLGRAQAQEVAVRLQSEFRPDHLISSEFLRARQTSDIIAEVLGLRSEPVAGIHERDFGCLKGQPYERLGELMKLDRLDSKPWQWRPPEGESLEDVRRRVVTVIERLRDRYSEREIVIVCHGAVIQAVCAHITGEWSDGTVPRNCGIVMLEHGPEGWAIPAMQDCWLSLKQL